MPFFIVFIVIVILSMIRIVPQSQMCIVERLGKYHAKWDAGIHFKVPIIDHVVRRVSTKEQVLDFPPQGVITKDNVTMQIDSIVFMKVVDAKAYTYGVEDPIIGVENLAATTLRNLVGQLDFDDTLTSRDYINTQMQQELDQATDPWGIKVMRVEVKNIQPPKEIQDVMTKQMKAEREKRQAILEAEAHKQSIVARAEGDKQAKVLAAEAERDAQIALAEGQAKSIKMVYEAEAEGLEKLNSAHISNSVLQLKSIEALKDIADGNATKIFIPNDITNTVASLGVAGEALGIGASIPAKPKQKLVKQQGVDPCGNTHSSKITETVSHVGNAIQQDVKQSGAMTPEERRKEIEKMLAEKHKK